MGKEYFLKPGISVTFVYPDEVYAFCHDFERSILTSIELGLNISPNKNIPAKTASKLQKKLVKNLKKNCSILKENDVEINSCHLPFGYDFDITAQDPRRLDKALKSMITVMQKAEQYAKPKYFVLHPGSPEWQKGLITRTTLKDSEINSRYQTLIQSIATLSRQTNTPICIENMTKGLFANTPEEQNQIIDTVNQLNQNQGYGEHQVFALVDVNHCSTVSPQQTILDVGNRLLGLHISDTKEGSYDNHLIMGEGTLNWNEIISSLDHVGFDGAFIHEARTGHNLFVNIGWNHSAAFHRYNNPKTEEIQQLEDDNLIESQIFCEEQEQ